MKGLLLLDSILRNEVIHPKSLFGFCQGNLILLPCCLKVVNDLSSHPLKVMPDLGLRVTVNSDDPAYFGEFLNDNFIAIADASSLSNGEIYQLAKNSFMASFLP